MTQIELEQKNDAEHAKMIDDLIRKRQMPAFAETDPDKQRDLFIRHGLTALAKVKHGRVYAVDLMAARELGAFALAYRDHVLENNGRFEMSELAKLLGELAQVRWTSDGGKTEENPHLIQSRPGPEVELKPITDPVTGLPIKNCFSDPVDLASQMLLEKENPQLAAYYRSTKDGTTFAMVAKIKAERESRDRIRAIEYGEKQHRENPFLLSGKEGLKAQSEFAREAEPHIVNWYQQEAKEPTLGFGNLSSRMAVAKRDAKLGMIHARAENILRQWLRQDADHLKEQQEANAKQLQATQQALATASAR